MALQVSIWKQRLERWSRPVQPLIDAVQLWLQADGLRMSAAMSFYGILSLAPLLLAVVGLLGWWLDRSYVENTLISQVQAVVGERVAQVIQGALSSAQNSGEGTLASVLGLVMMLSGATGVFVELQASLDKLWSMGEEPVPQTRAAWWSMAVSRLRGLSYVAGLGFLLLVSMLLSTAIQMVTKWASEELQLVPMGPLLGLVNELVSLGISVLLFLGLMRMGAGIKPSMRYLLMGAMTGAVLFTLGKQGLAWYLSTAAVVSAYGAAGSLVVVLMWFYFTSAILLFSAATAKACSKAGLRFRRPFASQAGAPATVDPQALPKTAGENI
ncbi:YihY/virulence factor BrkB family protein [Comamonas aquatilis]|uniref:YihY/virulence factor BrkB family protein n=1 Tax=Comamonas aquatilis TaxID=1778406 RepID=UPI0039EE7E25